MTFCQFSVIPGISFPEQQNLVSDDIMPILSQAEIIIIIIIIIIINIIIIIIMIVIIIIIIINIINIIIIIIINENL